VKRDSFPLPVEPALAVHAAPRAWRHAGAAQLVLAVWTIACYAKTAAAMVEIWTRSETFAHGYVVAPISLWLVWRIRGRLAGSVPRPAYWTLPLIALTGLSWLLGTLGTVNAVSQASFVAMLVLAVVAVLGSAVARQIAFPLAFLFFAVPFGEFMMPWLMERTADFTIVALRASGIPVYREGLHFVIPSGRWSVVEACSGIRYLLASLMVGTLFAYLNYRAVWRRIAFVAFAALVPIVANWLRAYLIVLIGHLSNNKLAVGVDHLIYGWLFFGVVMLLMLWVGSLWRESAPTARDATIRRAASLPPVAPFWWVAAACALLAGVWPAAQATLMAPATTAPAVLEPLRGLASAADGYTPRFENPAAQLHQRAERAGESLGLYVAYYRDQGNERKLVSSDNTLVRSDDRAWQSLGFGSRRVSLDGRSLTVRTARVRSVGGMQIVAWQWYWVDGVLTSSDALAKAFIAWSRLRGRGDDAAAVVFYAREHPGGDVNAALEAFVRDAWPDVRATLERTRNR
jgi:exosortase A